MTMKVCQTPTDSGDLKPGNFHTRSLKPIAGPMPASKSPPFIRMAANGEPIIAPPPKPMIARPVAMPRRSGNHFTSVDTGEM